VRELPGAIVQERTIEEARQSMQEVIRLLLEPREPDAEAKVISREPVTVDLGNKTAEGKNYSLYGHEGNRASVPWHKEIDNRTAALICNDLGIPRLEKK
jgi:hypothetical protein